VARLRVLKSVGELAPDVGGVSSLSQSFSLDPRRSICESVSAISGPVFAVGREVAAGLSGFSTGVLGWALSGLGGQVVTGVGGRQAPAEERFPALLPGPSPWAGG
jgi:hypothetical protein